jgi:ferredoxin-NADP reductase
MVMSLVARNRLPHIEHIHYAPDESAAIFGEELRRLSVAHPGYRYHELHTRSDTRRTTSRAHFSAIELERLCPDWRERDVFACGPASLLLAVERHFGQASRAAHLHVERFRPALAGTSPDVTPGRVLFVRSGVEAHADRGTELLRLAEMAGLQPRHGCRMGICHQCCVRLVSGRVRDLRTGTLTAAPGSFVQTCISAAAGDCQLDL